MACYYQRKHFNPFQIKKNNFFGAFKATLTLKEGTIFFIMLDSHLSLCFPFLCSVPLSSGTVAAVGAGRVASWVCWCNRVHSKTTDLLTGGTLVLNPCFFYLSEQSELCFLSFSYRIWYIWYISFCQTASFYISVVNCLLFSLFAFNTHINFDLFLYFERQSKLNIIFR